MDPKSIFSSSLTAEALDSASKHSSVTSELSLASIERFLEEETDPSVMDAVKTAADQAPFSTRSSQSASASGKSMYLARARSNYSSEHGSATGASSTSATSMSSASFSSAGRSGGIRKIGRKGRRRFQKTKAIMKGESSAVRYQCTFCHQNFRGKYEWRRHEGSHVANVDGWICMPDGSAVLDDSCMLCGKRSPDDAHLKKHNIQKCLGNPIETRKFSRKDHLKQHIDLVHCKSQGEVPSDNKGRQNTMLSRWFREADPKALDLSALWCGFCCKILPSWKDRLDHISNHFQQDNFGKHTQRPTWNTMTWKCRELSHPYVTHINNFKCGLCKTWSGSHDKLKEHEVLDHWAYDGFCTPFHSSLEFREHLLMHHCAVDHPELHELDKLIRESHLQAVEDERGCSVPSRALRILA